MKKNKKFIKLLPNKTVSQLELENGDNIYISYNQINLESTENFNDNNISDREILSNAIPQINLNNIPIPNSNRQLRKNPLINTIIGSIVLIILIIILIIYFTIPPIRPEPNFIKENLIIKKVYPSNMLFIFKSNHTDSMKMEGENVNKENPFQSSDFIFITREAYIEKNLTSLIEKEWYSGYI